MTWAALAATFAGLDPATVAALLAVAGVAGFLDSIAGGGGLLTLPALLMAGLPPAAALGVNKLQGSFGSGSATFAFARAGRIEWAAASPMALASCAGAMAGAALVAVLPANTLYAVMPILLLATALYMGLSPRVGDEDRHRRLAPATFAATAALGIGFYDGLFGPGAGSFYMLAFVTLLGFGVVRATAHSKLLNFGSNIGSLAVFAVTQPIAWGLGLAMGCCALAGAQAGSHLAMRKGARLVRPLVVAVSCAMALRLLLDPGNPYAHRLTDAASTIFRMIVPATN